MKNNLSRQEAAFNVIVTKDYALPSIGRVSNKNIVKSRGESSSHRQHESHKHPKFNYGSDPYSQENSKIDKFDAIFRKPKNSRAFNDKRMSDTSAMNVPTLKQYAKLSGALSGGSNQKSIPTMQHPKKAQSALGMHQPGPSKT